MSVRGVLYVHSCPPALCPHVSWAVSRVLGARMDLIWTEQPLAPGMLRAECDWTGAPGSAGRIASALRGWSPLRYEVVEEPSLGCDGERYSVTPALGLFRASMSANGDIVVTEDRLRALVSGASTAEGYADAIHLLLGAAWDAELEPFRQAGDGAPPSRLIRVG